MSRHRLFRGAGIEAAFDDGHNDKWDVNEATFGASPASPTSARYMRRAQGSSRIGEGSKVRAVYDAEGEWYTGRVVRVLAGGKYGVQFDGYDDWEICTQVEAVQSPRKPMSNPAPPGFVNTLGSDPKLGSTSNTSTTTTTTTTTAHPSAPSTSTSSKKSFSEPWDINLIQKQLPTVRSVVGDGIEESVVMDAIRRCNYNAERAIMELIEGGSTFAVPIEIGKAMTSPKSSNSKKKMSGLGAALMGSSPTNQSNQSGLPDSPRRSRTFSDSCELSDLDLLIATNPKTTDKNKKKTIQNPKDQDNVPKIPTISRSQLHQPTLKKQQEGETKRNTNGNTHKHTTPKKQKNKTQFDKLRQTSTSNTPKKISKNDLAKRQKHIDELLLSKQENITNTNSDGTIADSAKPVLNMVVIGHVDAGKSTMMGHLLWKLGEIDKRTMRKFEKESKEQGKASFKYAWALDDQGEERERGVTIDVATKNFSLPNRQVVLLDAPGHKDFIPNMISGASQADVALLVVASGEDEFSSGFVGGGQTKEHVTLVRSMGIKQIVVAVNKMDMIDWSQKRYKTICETLNPFFIKTGFRSENIRYVPVSGLGGENLVVRDAEGPLSKWTGTWGPTLAECINEFRPQNRDRMMKKPLRMSIADVYKSQRLGALTVSGRIQTGTLVVGDQVRVMPVYELCTVKAMSDHRGITCKCAVAGTNIEIGLTGLDSDAMLGVGTLLCDPHNTIPLVRRFNARIQTLEALKIPIIKGTKYTMHIHNTDVPVHISKLIQKRNRKEGPDGEEKKKPRTIGRDEIGVVSITIGDGVKGGICLERFEDFPAIGRVLLRDNGVTVAMGTVMKIKECI